MSTTATGSSPYQAFARIFTSYHDQYSEPGPSNHQIVSSIRYDAILDEQGGLLSSLMSAIEEEIKSKGSDGWDQDMDEGLTGDEKEALLLEHRTWQLLRTVYDNRLPREEAGFAPASSQAVLLDNPYITPGDLIQLFIDEDDELSLLVTLVDHLQSRPLLTSPPPLESRHGYLPATLRRAKAQQLAGAPDAGPRRPDSLDPDFTLREPQGTGLAGEDQTYQHPLLETLFDLVRHGELDQAVKVCEMGGEPWRGATLMGGRRWAMGGMTAGDDSDGMALEGNRRRNLWKKACRSIARNPILSPSERSLYAALTSDLPTLLPACTSWEDHLWAHLQARVEARLDARWRELGGFWEEESGALSSGVEEDGVRPGGGLAEIFGEMAEWQNASISAAFRNPYYVAQRMIMLGRTDALLSQFAGQLSNIEEKTSPELVGPLIRFFAHLILILRNLNQPVSETPANAILQAYLQILEREGNDHLVAMYAACLREGSGEESYARFLYAMDPTATKESRIEALSRAKTHNLDVASIARETVRLTLEEAFAAIPALSKEQPDITLFTTGLTQRDVHLIRSIEWLTMSPDTAQDAVVKANDVGRYFLSLGQANAAQALLKTLPPNLTAIVNDENDDDYQLLEHEDISRLFGVFACHELVDDVLGRAPKATSTKMEQHNWRKSLNGAIERVQQSTLELLTSDWLRFPLSPESENATQRLKELRRIRQIFIPDLILRLHTLLITHSALFPALIQTALDLTKVIAKEENHAYEEFFVGASDAGRLVDYLERVREVGMMALKNGGSAFQVRVAS